MVGETDHRKRKLIVKGLITVGVFSAIMLIYISLNGGPPAMFPALIFYFPIGAALLTEPAYLLPVTKVPGPGPILITGLMMAIFCYVIGMHIGMSIGYLAGSVLTDLVARTGCYRNIKINILSYIVFCLGGTGSYLVYFVNSQTWVSRVSEEGIPQEYLDTMAATVSHWILISMLTGTVLVTLLSGFVGNRLLKKQFEKARITA